MDRKAFLKYAGLGTAGVAVNSALGPLAQGCTTNKKRPNILLIMTDDMGFSDIGCYGSQIKTSNIDYLAKRGVKLTQFYNAARCCPTRASLLTGLYPHQTGVGHMTGDRGADGYQGDLNNKCVTIAEVLSQAGYANYMSGKWHLTKHIGHWTNEEELTSKYNWPMQRGFDQFYGTIIGAGSYYDPISLTRNNEPIAPGSDDFYYTDAITDEMDNFITKHLENKKEEPFFGYLSYTAPHWPLHAFEEDIKQYENLYRAGWDEIREQRLAKMQDIELVDPSWKLSERDPRVPAWEDEEHKEWEVRRMAVYAAQIDRMDRGIGRIINTLKEQNELDNTLVFFMADNGGAAEIITEKWTRLHAIPEETRDGRKVKVGNSPEIMPGPETTYQSYGIGWANTSNCPFRLYKHFVHEGGIASPLIVHWPEGISAEDEWRNQQSHVIDIMSTCIDVADAEYPESYNGNSIHPMEGISLVGTFEDDPEERNAPIFWEHQGNRAIREGRWKLVSRYNEEWELFDVVEDRTETTDLSSKYPEILRELEDKYENWAERIGVLPWPVVSEN